MSLSFIKEYHEGNSNLEITPTDPKEAIYIYKCVKSTIRVHGKLNSIVIGQFYMYYTFYLYIIHLYTYNRACAYKLDWCVCSIDPFSLSLKPLNIFIKILQLLQKILSQKIAQEVKFELT